MDERLLQIAQELYTFQGNLCFVENVDRGYLSHNAILRDDKEKYFLKQYRFDDSYRVIEIQNAKKFFYDKGIPVIMPIESKEKSTFFVYEKKIYSLFPFVEGFHELNDIAFRSAGEMFARIHLAGKDEKNRIVKPRSFAWDRERFFDRVKILREIIDQKQKKDQYDDTALECLDIKIDLVKRYTETYKDFRLLQDNWQILHGDYHDENLFFDKDGNVTHVFDWEKVNYGPRGLDVARSLFLMCFWDDFYDEHFRDAKTYLKAYFSIYPMDKEYFKEAVEAWNMEQIHSLWVLESYYVSHNERTKFLIEPHLKRLCYVSKHADEYVRRIVGMLD